MQLWYDVSYELSRAFPVGLSHDLKLPGNWGRHVTSPHGWRDSVQELSKEAKEQIIGSLVEQGILTIDFGFTAYATNAYLKASRRGLRGKKRFQDIAWQLPLKKFEAQSLQPRARASAKQKLITKFSHGTMQRTNWK